MTAVPKKIVVDEKGSPLEVIISWADYQDLAERLGWDLPESEAAELQEAIADWRAGNQDAFVPISEVK
jgi:hypothetical protein